MEKIEYLACKFRKAIEVAKSEGKFTYDQMFRNFPQGCCGITSELLSKFLLDNGIKAELTYVCGIYYNDLLESPSHAWLLANNNIVIDITGDQFKHYPAPVKFNKSIYVGFSNEFYELFEIREREICNNYYPLDDTYVRNHLSRKQLYELILECIN